LEAYIAMSDRRSSSEDDSASRPVLMDKPTLAPIVSLRSSIEMDWASRESSV
jgi:hypothetical protein